MGNKVPQVPRGMGGTREFLVKIAKEVPREQGIKKGSNFRTIEEFPGKSREPIPGEYAKKWHITDILEYKLDSVTSSICMASLTINCNICKKHIIKDFLICAKCNRVFHLCAQSKKESTVQSNKFSWSYVP